MWIMLNDCFFSIVSKDCARDELLVRARRKGDIEKLWPTAKITRDAGTDYLYRAAIKKVEIKAALANEVDRVTYANFKDSMGKSPEDSCLHAAYLRCWHALLDLQPTRVWRADLELPFGAAVASAQKPRHTRRRRKTRRKK